MNTRFLCLAMTLVLAARAGAATSIPGPRPDASVHAFFELSAPETCPFPSNYFSVADSTHLTGLRVNLPKPDCGVRISECRDLDVINQLDGFNPQPRVSIPFDADIDVTTVRSDTVFFISLGDVAAGGDRGGRIIGINQVVWDPPPDTSDTLYEESDEFLDQLRTGLDDEAVQTLAIDPAHPSVIYAGTASGHVFRSANRGDDWARFDLGMHGASVASLAISPSGDLYAATSGGVFTYQRDRRYLDGAVTYAVALRTYHSNYLSRALCGDREVNGAAASVGPCETFTLYDVNGGALMDGDTVYLQAPNSSFVAAENGGAGGCIGCESPLNANRAVAGQWETSPFIAPGVPGASPTATRSTCSHRRDFVAAEPDGGVNANRVVPREWETFTLMMRQWSRG